MRVHSLLAAGFITALAPASRADDPPGPLVTAAPVAPVSAAPIAPASAAPMSAVPPPYAPPPGYYALPPGGYWGPPPSEQTGTKRRSTGMMVTGIVFTGLGVANLALGAVTIALNPGRMCAVSEGDFAAGENDGCTTDPSFTIAGGIMMGAGGTLLAAGIPLWIVGAGKPKPEASTASLRPTRPTLMVGPRAAAVRWSF